MSRRRSSPIRFGVSLFAFALGSSVLTVSQRGAARSTGIAASSCTGCHNGGTPGALKLGSSSATLSPGERAEFTLSIAGDYRVGGVFLTSNQVGELQLLADQGLRQVTGGLAHERPKPASGGAVEFHFAWVPPATPGAVRFYAYAVGGNGDNRSTGDAPMDQSFDFVFGCAPQTFYLDGDGDGAGRQDISALGCADAPPAMYVADASDCDDFNARAYPGAPELCNGIDDDCDGQVDENAAPVELWPDADGDGYYDARTEKVGTPRSGCAGLKGWAALPGDCQPMNPDVHPGVTEICNYIDDDCDGDVDERVRPTCGAGWCRRESPSCDAQDCRPGNPTEEKCNLLDDDCDGELDEGADLCPSDQTCDSGRCGGGEVSGGGARASGQAGSAPALGGGSSAPTSASGASASGTSGSGPASVAQTSSGCALGAGGAHGALTLLGLAALAASLRRRKPA